MAWMAAALTVFVIANLAVMYLWFCQRSLEKSLAPHREINLMPDMNKRVPVGTGDGFGSGTSIALAPRYGASAGAGAATPVGIAAMPPSTPVKAATTKGTTTKTKTTKAKTVKPVTAKAKATTAGTTTKPKARAKAVTVAKPKAVVKPKVTAKRKAVVVPRADKTDDVSLISGVGPTLKLKLAGAGVTSLKQIAKMSPKKLEALDDELNLGGRCVNEQWIEQAKELVAGKPPRAKIDRAAAKS